MTANYNQSSFDVDIRKLTFAEVYDLWCRSKFKGNPIKSAYEKRLLADVQVRYLAARYMKGGIKTKAGKNRLPIAEKIFPLVEGFYMPANKFLLTVDGAPLPNAQNLRTKI